MTPLEPEPLRTDAGPVRQLPAVVWIILQGALGLAMVWPINGWDWDIAAIPGYLLVGLAACLFGWTLVHNRLGNWRVAPEPKPNAQLIISGPYRYMRHPMYCGLLVLALAFVLLDCHPVKIGVAAALYVVLRIKSGIEERHLRQHFPHYAEYSHRTGRFMPRPLFESDK